MNKMSVRRKLVIATWSSPREGNIYGKLTVDATELLRYIAHLREKTGEKVTVTHIVGRAVGLALERAPGLNGRILFGRFVPYDNVSLSFLVALEEGQNLAKVKVEDANRKSVTELARELRTYAERLRKGKDEAFEKSQGPLRLLPTWIIRPLLWCTGWLTSALGISAPALGLEAFPFGAAIITSVGMFGLDEGFAPPTPFARAPLLVLVGAIRDAPAVDAEGALCVRPQMTITATIDHRFMDGFQGAILAKTARTILEDPWSLEEPEAAGALAPAPQT